jgi:membrane protease YdiL (CAAX protease family)
VLVYLGLASAAWAAGRRLLAPRRQRAVPWTALEILAVLLLVNFVLVTLCYLFLLTSGLGESLYGRDVMTAARAGGDKLAQARVGLLALALAFPLQVLATVSLLCRRSGTRPYQLGLTTWRAGRNALLGVLGAVILTPPVLALNLLVTELVSLLSGGKGISEHAFSQLANDSALSGGEVALIVLLAMVAAPVLEELLFRGMLLFWLVRNKWGTLLVMALAFLVVAVPVVEELLFHGMLPNRSWQAFGPPLFVLALVPGFVWVYQRDRSRFGPALYSSSLLFAAWHSAWPSPVALFVLALGLGWLAYRTQSLVGPMVLHSLFNAVACVQILLARFHPI